MREEFLGFEKSINAGKPGHRPKGMLRQDGPPEFEAASAVVGIEGVA